MDAENAFGAISKNDTIILRIIFGSSMKVERTIDNFIQLIDNGYNIIKLQLYYFMLLNEKEIKLILEAIARNKTIKKLSFHFYDIGEYKLEWYKQFSESMKNVLNNNPCIEHLELLSSCDINIIDEIVKNKPHTLKHLEVSGRYGIKKESLELLLKDDSMQTIIVEIDLLEFGISRSLFRNNKSLLQFQYGYEIFGYSSNGTERIACNAAIDQMLGINGKARSKAKRAALYLIAIRKYRSKLSGSVVWIPKEVVTIIAKLIHNSYIDDAWRT